VSAARARTPARALAPAVAAILALGGCSQINAALSKQWAVVSFKPDTTVRTLLKVREACSHVPNVRPLGPPAVSSELDMTYSVRYQTSKATGANLAALKSCLQRFSAVSGVSFRDTGNKD
jgi:hypothetical protein